MHAPVQPVATQWVLTGTSPTGERLRFRVTAGHPRTLGRATGATFIVDAPLVSRIHCRLTVSADGQLHVEDLDSTNGTFVNGRRVERAALAPGDCLRVGRAELTVQREAPLPPPTAD